MQASRKDCGVYQCVIQNEYGTDSTDFLLSAEGELPAWPVSNTSPSLGPVIPVAWALFACKPPPVHTDTQCQGHKRATCEVGMVLARRVVWAEGW